MNNQRSLLALERLELIVAVDATRAVSDAFKLSSTLLGLVTARRNALSGAVSAAGLAEGDRAGASAACRAALDRLEALHRAGYAWLRGLLPDIVPDPGGGLGPFISDAVRLQLLTDYGWASGEIGLFTDARREQMAVQAEIAAAVSVANPGWHYPLELRDAISAQYILLQGHQPLATGGSRQAATQAADTATEAAEDMVARVRGAYIAASDDGDRTPQLARIGLQPRRLPGEATSGTLPGTPAPPILDLAARTLTLPALPEEATSIRAYRQPAGGARELCGISLGPVVSLVMSGPLTPGTVYEAWIVGVLSDREGPDSAKVTFTAP